MVPAPATAAPGRVGPMGRFPRWAWSGGVTCCLGVLGMVAAHCGAHLLSGLAGIGASEHSEHLHHAHLGHSGAEHGTDEMVHLLPAATASSLALLIALVAGIVALRRYGRPTTPSVGRLLTIQFVALVTLETIQIEMSSMSWADAAGNHLIYAAAMAQIPVAHLIHRWCRRTIAIARKLVGAATVPFTTASTLVLALAPTGLRVRRGLLLSLSSAPRGPPTGRFIRI